MAIKNPFRADAKAAPLPSAEGAPDWRKHPDILSHQARLESARAKLPTMAATLEHMQQRYQEAEETAARCEMLAAAGKPLPDGIASLDEVEQAVKRARAQYLVARVAHADTAKEHADLEASAQTVEEAARAEVGRQMSDEYFALLTAQKAALEAAIAAQDAAQAYQEKIREAFPGYIADDRAFNQTLGIGIWPLNDLRRSTPMWPNGRLDGWFQRYEQIKEQRAHLAQPIPPENR